MAKKILILLLAVMLVFCIASCGKKDVEYKVTLKVDGEDYGSFMTSDKSIELPTPEVPADKKDTHMFYGWYFIDANANARIYVDNDYFAGNSVKGDLTIHAEFIEILSVSYNKNAGGYYIDNLGVKGVIKELVVPAEYTTDKGTYPIVGISSSAFKGESELVSVEFKGVITDVGNNAFEGCTKLESVKIKAGVEKVLSSTLRLMQISYHRSRISLSLLPLSSTVVTRSLTVASILLLILLPYLFAMVSSLSARLHSTSVSALPRSLSPLPYLPSLSMRSPTAALLRRWQ